MGQLLQAFNINELAGATGLILGALGGLLAIIWKSRCHCRMNLCYLCQCERRPPPDAEPANSSDEEAVLPATAPSAAVLPATEESAPVPSAPVPSAAARP